MDKKSKKKEKADMSMLEGGRVNVNRVVLVGGWGD